MANTGIRALSTKKQQEFTKRFGEWLESQGAIYDRTNVYDYTLESITGKMLVHLPSSRMYGYEVFCRFVEPINEQAISICGRGIGRTGKWNHHITDVDMSVDDAIAQMISWVEPVLLTVEE